MKIKLHIEGEKARVATLPYSDADYVECDGSCPSCKKAPLFVAGVKGSIVRGHDTMTSTGACLACKVTVGKLVVTFDTIFGIEEDERVLNGRCRVY